MQQQQQASKRDDERQRLHHVAHYGGAGSQYFSTLSLLQCLSLYFQITVTVIAAANAKYSECRQSRAKAYPMEQAAH